MYVNGLWDIYGIAAIGARSLNIIIIICLFVTFRIKPRIRCTLLEVLECYLRRWQVAPNDVIRFYCDTMAEILAGLID